MKQIYLALAVVLAATQADAATITLDLTSPVHVGSIFDVVVKATNVFAGRAADDSLIGFGFDVNVGNPAIVSLVGEDIGPLFDDFSGLFPGTDISGLAGIATNFEL